MYVHYHLNMPNLPWRPTCIIFEWCICITWKLHNAYYTEDVIS